MADTPSRARVDGLPAVPLSTEADSAGGFDGVTGGNGSDVTPTAPVAKGPETSAPRVRVAVRLHPDTNERAKYWADKANISANEYIVEAVEEKVRRENGDYDLPTLEIARLGQLIDQMASLSTNVGNLERVTVTGFDSLMGLTRGDNYLLDTEDGEIGEEQP
ncbi:UNVERIFIED_ORG: putative DNA-binding protein [Arthrobacter sp. UYCu721]